MTEQQTSDVLFDDLSLLRSSGFDDAANEIERLRRERDLYKFQAETNAETIKNMQNSSLDVARELWLNK